MEFLGSITLKMILYPVIGGGIGFGYYKFVGCKSGTCPITNNPYSSIIYGALMGFLLAS